MCRQRKTAVAEYGFAGYVGCKGSLPSKAAGSIESHPHPKRDVRQAALIEDAVRPGRENTVLGDEAYTVSLAHGNGCVICEAGEAGVFLLQHTDLKTWAGGRGSARDGSVTVRSDRWCALRRYRRRQRHTWRWSRVGDPAPVRVGEAVMEQRLQTKEEYLEKNNLVAHKCSAGSTSIFWVNDVTWALVTNTSSGWVMIPGLKFCPFCGGVLMGKTSETRTDRLNFILKALQERSSGLDDKLALNWAFELRSAALFLENAPPELFEAARNRLGLLEA